MPLLLFCPAQRGENREDEVMLPQLVVWFVCCCFLNKHFRGGQNISTPQSQAAPLKSTWLYEQYSVLNRAHTLRLWMGFWCWPPHATVYHNHMDVRIANSDTKKTLTDIPSSFAPRDSGVWTGDTFGRSLWLWEKRYSKMHQVWPGVAHDSR